MSAHKEGRKTTFQSLKQLFTDNVAGFSFTYGLSALENLFNLLYPFVTGVAINGLLNGSYQGLLFFLAIWTAHAVVGICRQRYDTVVFTRMYGKLATKMVLAQHKQGVDNSRIAARASLAREIVDFFEVDVPLVITSIFGFLGSLGMLFVYDLPIGGACLFFLLPLFLINRYYARTALRLNSSLNDQLEKEVEIIGRGERQEIERHYSLLSGWRVRLSNAESTNWGILELFMIGLTAFVIIRAASISTTAEAGTIYAIMAYMWNYASSLTGVPVLIQKASRLRDINARIAVENID